MNKKAALSQLSIIEHLHNDHLLWGYACQHHVNVSTLKAEYRVEWRGRYGFIPGIDIYCNGIIQSTMTPFGAYKYIRSGMMRYADVTVPASHY